MLKDPSYKQNKVIASVLKLLLIALMLLYIIFYLDIDFKEIFYSMHSFNSVYIVLFFICMLSIEYLQVPIVQSLIKPYNIYLKAHFVYKVNIISVFYYIFMPFGRVTGGAIRWHRLGKKAGDKKALFNVVALQNILELLLYSIVAVFIFLYNNPLDKSYHFLSYALSFMLTLFIVISLIALINKRVMIYIHKILVNPLISLFPSSLQEKINSLWNSIFAYNKGYKALSFAFLYTLAYRMGYLLLFYLIAFEINIAISFTQLISLFIVSNMLSFLPLPLNGLGTRELIFINLCAFYGIAKEEALLYSLSIFSFTVLLGAFGGLLELIGQFAYRKNTRS